MPYQENPRTGGGGFQESTRFDVIFSLVTPKKRVSIDEFAACVSLEAYSFVDESGGGEVSWVMSLRTKVLSAKGEAKEEIDRWDR